MKSIGLRRLAGKFYPWITTAELADWLNEASGGAGQWTSAQVLEMLRESGAVTQIPARDSSGRTSSKKRKTGKTPRPRYGTTIARIREHLRDVYDALFVEVDEDVAAQQLGAIE